jgi:hypothetical protein
MKVGDSPDGLIFELRMAAKKFKSINERPALSSGREAGFCPRSDKIAPPLLTKKTDQT